jgi:hypothetical protein
VKFEHEKDPSLSLESQAIILGVAMLGFKNQDPMVFNP